MAFSSSTFVFGEQPAASKWDQLWRNDDALRDGTGQQWANDQWIQALNSGASAVNVIKIDNDNYLRLGQVPSKYVASTSTLDNVLIQVGFDYIIGAGADHLTETITFPTAYTSAPLVFVTGLNARATTSGAPDTPDDFDVLITANCLSATAVNITTSGFDISLARSDSGTFTNNNNYGYSWLAIGAKT